MESIRQTVAIRSRTTDFYELLIVKPQKCQFENGVKVLFKHVNASQIVHVVTIALQSNRNK